jgi:polar amino acid transport system permease protein
VTTPARDLEVIPVRRPGRIIASVVLVIVVAQIAQGTARNKNFKWQVFADYFTAGPVITGVEHTIELTLLAMLIGVAGGILLAIGRVSDNPIISGVSWTYVWFFRGTPVLVQIIFWYNIAALFPRLGFGIPFGGPQLFSGSGNDITLFAAALLGLGLNEAAYMAEIVRAGLISVDEGQTEAAAALGMKRGQILRRIVLPQAMRVIVPPTGNETISMLKTSSLASVIAYVELLQSVQNIYSRTYQVIPLLVVSMVWYLIMTSVLTTGQYYLERRFARGSSRALPPTPIQRIQRMALPGRRA